MTFLAGELPSVAPLVLVDDEQAANTTARAQLMQLRIVRGRVMAFMIPILTTYFGVIISMPKYGCSTVGMRTEPSAR